MEESLIENKYPCGNISGFSHSIEMKHSVVVVEVLVWVYYRLYNCPKNCIVLGCDILSVTLLVNLWITLQSNLLFAWRVGMFHHSGKRALQVMKITLLCP